MTSSVHPGHHAPKPQLPTLGRLPWRPIAALCLCNCAHFYAICSLFSYGGIMSADLGWASDRDHAGNFAGFLQSSNVIGRMPTASLWGIFADRFGLRAGMCMAMMAILFGGMIFGFCVDSTAAVVTRFLFFGLANGWVTFFGPITMELGGTERQTEITGKVFGAGALVQLLGPAIGGWTYGLIPRFPAAVPSLIGSVVSLSALLALWFWMPQLRTGYQRPQTEEAETDATSASVSRVCCTWPLPVLIALRSTQGFLNFAFFEVVPLWAISSRSSGGLALSEGSLGLILAASGVGSGIFMAFAMAKVTKRLGLQWMSICANVCIAGCLLLLPFTSSAVIAGALHMVANAAMGTLGAAYIACINNVTPHGLRGLVNGVCTTFESLGKGVGPAGTAVAFAWTLSRWGLAGHSLVFIGMAFLHVLLVLGTLILPSEINGGGQVSSVEKAKSSPCVREESTSSLPAPSFIGVGAVAATSVTAELDDSVSCMEHTETSRDDAELLPLASNR